jgi:hypothetical protein
VRVNKNNRNAAHGELRKPTADELRAAIEEAVRDPKLQQAMSVAWLRERLTLFQNTGNPLFAWEIYRNRRRSRNAIPSAVLAHFDDVAERVLALANRRARTAQDLLEAFTLKSRVGHGGLTRIFTQHAHCDRDMELALEVANLRFDGIGLKCAQQKVAARQRVGGPRGGYSFTTVRNAWKKYGANLPAPGMSVSCSVARILSQVMTPT